MAVIPCIYWPVTVAAAAMNLRLRRTPAAGGGEVTTDNVIPAATYYAHEGAGSLAAAIEALFTPAVNGVSVAVAVSNAGMVTITVSGLDGTTACEIDWSGTPAAATLVTALGFDTALTDTVNAVGGVATFTATKQMPRYWTPDVPSASDEPQDAQEVVVTRTQGGQNAFDRLGAWEGRRVEFQFVPAAKIKTDSETTANTAVERLLKDATAPARFRFWNDRDTLASGFDDYYLDAEVLPEIRPQRFSPAVNLYSLTLPMWEHVA